MNSCILKIIFRKILNFIWCLKILNSDRLLSKTFKRNVFHFFGNLCKYVAKSFLCFVHPIFSSFGFWSLQLRDLLSIFFHLALQNVNKDYVIFFVFSSTKVTKMKNEMTETYGIYVKYFLSFPQKKN